jgi:hypothetical protein
MEHAVHLERIPPNLQFPPEFHERLQFDTETHRLVHQGFMSKAEFDRLWMASEDWSYRRALEELFRLCSEAADERPRGLRTWLGSLLGGMRKEP